MLIRYVLPRLIRRFTPAAMFHLLLQRGWFVRSGGETRLPRVVFDRYQQTINASGQTLQDKRAMVFGYGGSFTLGCMLLQAGAAHVVLCDKYAAPDDYYNRHLLPEFSLYLEEKPDHRPYRILPRPKYLTILKADVRELVQQGNFQPVDLVISTSVFEHLDDVDSSLQALAAITLPDGFHLHYINLQDHLFKYPFQMLTYTEEQWRKWLNPPSNLNRYRVPDYQGVFEKHFEHVEMVIIQRNLEAFNSVHSHIRPEFLTGDDQVDSATKLQVFASRPRRGQRSLVSAGASDLK